MGGRTFVVRGMIRRLEYISQGNTHQREHSRPIRLGGSCGNSRKGYRLTRQSHKKTNSEYRLVTGAPLYTPTKSNQHTSFNFQIYKLNTKRTSVTSSYSIYRFNKNPCCPAKFTTTFSCLFHQFFGSPLPATILAPPVDVSALAPFVAGAGAAKAAVPHGSSDEYVGCFCALG